MSIKSTLIAALTGTVLLSTAPAHAEFGDTLKKVKERGALACTGHNGSYMGLAEVDDKGNWKGFDIDLCRAVATAIFAAPPSVVLFVAGGCESFGICSNAAGG